MDEAYKDIPEPNSLDSMEGVENQEIINKKPEITEERFRYFVSDCKSMMSWEDFHMHSRFSETGFSDLGYPELGKRWAYAYLKKQIDEQLSTKGGVSHLLNKAYEVLAYDEHIDDEVRRNLGEMLGKLYEAGGRFSLAYEYYFQNCRDKYKDKLDSVRMKIENVDGIRGGDIWKYIPEGHAPEDFPNFKEASTRAEKDAIESKLFEDFLKVVPEEILQIDTKKEFALLMEEARKIIEKMSVQA